MLLLTDPAVVVAAIAITVLVAVLRHRGGLALLAVVGPVVTVLLTELVAKPLVGRRYHGDYLCYPSGHTGGVLSLLTMLVAAAWTGRSLLLRLLAAAAWLVLGAVAATALVGAHYHYPTDTMGGVGLSVGTVLLLHLLIEHIRRGRQEVGSASASRASAVSRESARRYFFRYPPRSISSSNSSESGAPDTATGTARS